MTKNDLKFIDEAVRLLRSGEVKRAIEERRAHLQVSRIARWPRVVDDTCGKTLERVQQSLIPSLLRLRGPQLVPAGLGDHLGRSWLGTYITEAAIRKVGQARLARDFARDLLAEARERCFLVRTIFPLANFSAERAFRIAGRLSGRAYAFKFMEHPPAGPASLGFYVLPGEELTPWWQVSYGLGGAKWSIVCDTTVKKGDQSYTMFGDPAASELHAAMITALRLFKAGALHAPISFVSRKLLYMSGTCAMSGSFNRAFGGPDLELAARDVRRFRRFWQWFVRFIPLASHLPPRIMLAISYFESSYSKLGVAKFLDLHIAWEALFGLEGGQTFRLPLRAAALLSPDKRRAVDMVDQVKGMWDTRNKIAHGSLEATKQKFQRKVQALTPKLESLLRTAIVRHVKVFEELGRDNAAYEKAVGQDFDQRFVFGRWR